MAATHRAPKQWCLGKRETLTTFESWWQNITYTLKQDHSFLPYLRNETTWLPKSRTSSNRGFMNDGVDVPQQSRQTAEQKAATLEMMLGQIANYCPVISRNTITKKCKSIGEIYQTIRLHYGFHSSGSQFLDFADIKLEPDELPEDLYQRIVAFVEDNLMTSTNGITHHGAPTTDDEEVTPTLENFIVLTWLQLLHKELPKLVKQRYGTELRSRSLATIKPEISIALGSLLDELHATEESRAFRSTTTKRFQPSYSKAHKGSHTKVCPLCKEAGRPAVHYLSQCTYLPISDRKYLAKARQVAEIFESPDNYDDDPLPEVFQDQEVSNQRVEIRPSPYINTFYGHHLVRVTIDTGCTGDMIRASTARELGIPITKATQSVKQADGRSALKVIGEARMKLTHGSRIFEFSGLVVESLDVDLLAGMPFLHRNQLGVFPAKHEILFGDGSVLKYKRDEPETYSSSRRVIVLRAPPKACTVWPGDYIEVSLPENEDPDRTYAIEPRVDTKRNSEWLQPCELESIAGKLRIPNLSEEIIHIKRNEHRCQALPTYTPESNAPRDVVALKSTSIKPETGAVVDMIKLDPDGILDESDKARFHLLHIEYAEVFNPEFKGYNGALGKCDAKVNMGPVLPPQRKGRVPQYSRDKLTELQSQFDELEAMGVFKHPADIGISVEYLNPSFLVKKASGGFRLVTAFAEVGKYAKPQPSLMPDVDSTLRQIGQWKYIIVSDLSKAFYQIPLAEESMKYCGVATPYKGVRVYTRCAMGMPGSETALEELLCKVLGDLLQEGCVARLADDLFCGGQTIPELFHNWRRILSQLHTCSLNLSASKTIIAPKSAMILGWIWEQGRIRASPHRLSTLSSCNPPDTVKGMRSFIGAYKVLSRVIPRCASYISALESSTVGLASKDSIHWSDELHASFKQAQYALSKSRTIVLPHVNDQLWIITDGSVKQQGIGATLYVHRSDGLKLAGFFSSKLRDRQVSWLPCEIEALAIASATKHFSPFIIQSRHKTCILTDSKPCVQAYEKLCRGEFSASPRVTSFLSTVSRFQASIRHIAGTANLPSDHASRNAPPCSEPMCQICSFVAQTEDSVVRELSVTDILKGNARLPFTSRTAWKSIQAECKDLRRTRAHLQQGTRPSKKQTDIKDIKRYLNVASISRDGILVVQRCDPLAPKRECIIIPRQALDGLLTALHISLDHPSPHQLKCAFQRYLFALDLDKAIAAVSNGCHMCASLRNNSHAKIDQSTGPPPDHVGNTFSADVMKRNSQLILVVREYVTSFTMSCLLKSERKEDLRDALIQLCVGLCPLDGPNSIIRTDAAPGFRALLRDPMLQHHKLEVELGRAKNVNKNPVGEKAIRELEDELLRQNGTGGIITPVVLATATARLNSRIRSRGFSSREMLHQRDQFVNSQLPINDQQLIMSQYKQKLSNHAYSEKAKAPKGVLRSTPTICVGDIVYLHCDRNKHKARERYIVVRTDGPWCEVKKFTGSQLRAESYKVKKSECFLLPKYESQDKIYEPNLDDDDVSIRDDSLEATDTIENTTALEQYDDLGTEIDSSQRPETVDQITTDPDIPPEISTPLSDEEALQYPETDSVGEVVVPSQTYVNSRPKRSRKQPVWMKDYVSF